MTIQTSCVVQMSKISMVFTEKDTTISGRLKVIDFMGIT